MEPAAELELRQKLVTINKQAAVLLDEYERTGEQERAKAALELQDRKVRLLDWFPTKQEK